MDARIEHCTVCWGYRDRALVLAEALRTRFDAKVAVIDGTLGQFDVRVDGELIWTRGEKLLARAKPPRLPDVSEVITAVDRRKSLPEQKTSLTENARYQFSPEAAKRFYDRFGLWQDAQFYERAALGRLMAHSDFRHASAVFELGSGTGKLAECLLKTNLPDNASYTGVDISTTMIRIASERLANWRGRATLQQADGTARLPYVEGVFDRFIAAYVLDLLSRSAIDHVLSEALSLKVSNAAEASETAMPMTQVAHPKRSNSCPRTALPTRPPKK